MPIKVVNSSGVVSTINIVLPASFSIGQYLNQLTDSSSQDYFFDVNGNYQGIGPAVTGDIP